MSGRGRAMNFATWDLCRRYLLIAKSIRRRNPTQDGEEEIRFAEARIRAVTSDPDRAKALVNALKISSDPNDERLIQWAVPLLASMHTAAADAELEKYSAALNRLPAQSAERRWLSLLPESIRSPCGR